MSFEQLLKAYPHWTAWGIDDPARPGFANSRRLLEQGCEDFDFAVRWLERNRIPCRNSVGIKNAVEFSTRRSVPNGIVCLALRHLAIPTTVRGSQLHLIV